MVVLHMTCVNALKKLSIIDQTSNIYIYAYTCTLGNFLRKEINIFLLKTNIRLENKLK